MRETYRSGKKTFFMESKSFVFDCQVQACKEFFQKKLPRVELHPLAEEAKPKNMKAFKGPIYDITGLDAQQIVSVLSCIVNDKDQFKMNKTFYLLIHSSNPNDDVEELFRVKARPTKYQPGNGIVFLRPRGKKSFKGSKKYEELNGVLKAGYDSYDDKGSFICSNTKSFAEDIKQLFKNNVQKKDIPQATLEVYTILLFEIARRLVTVDNPNEMKMAFDVLPIGSAIVRLVKLLELGNCPFEDVFLPGKKFHCFSGNPDVRRKAIEKINEAMATIEEEAVTKERHLKELEELFCFEGRLKEISVKEEEQLAKQLQDLQLLLSLSSDAENYTAFDYSE